MELLHLRVVLAAIDADDSASNVLRSAHELASAAGASLHVVNVAPMGSKHQSASSAEDVRSEAMTRLLDRVGLTASDVPRHLLSGDPAHLIRSLADKLGADVIVLGRHRGRRADTRGLGSTALAVVTNSWAPCLVLSSDMRLPLERVLVPVDLSDTSRGALGVALAWASALRGATRNGESAPDAAVNLTALFVDKSTSVAGDVGKQTRALENELHRLRQDAGTWASVDIAGVRRSGSDVAATIADYAAENASDLVVLGTRGLGLDDVGRLGSVSLDVVRRAPVPVLLVPPAVWNSYSLRE